MAEDILSPTADQRKCSAQNQSLHSLHRSIVTIYVGPKERPFYLHKGRSCQQSSFFEKAFHGSFAEASTGSLEEDGVEEFVVFEEWLYSQKLGDLKDCADPNLLLAKVFCFADRVGVSALQNIALDAIRDQAIGLGISSSSAGIIDGMPQSYETCSDEYPSILPWGRRTPSPGVQRLEIKYLSPATPSAVHFTYQNTLKGSSLRRLFADIFAFNVKVETLQADITTLPIEFIEDIIIINMKRLPLRLSNEKADFDTGTDEYYVQDTLPDRKSSVYQNGLGDVSADKADDKQDDSGGVFKVGKNSKKKKRKEKRSRSEVTVQD